MKYPLGTKFMSGGKHPKLCEVVAIHTTRDQNGDLVKERYVATHQFMQQTVTEHDVIGVTIARGLCDDKGVKL